MRLVQCQASNSSNGRPLKAPLVKSNAEIKATIIPFLRGGRRLEMKLLWKYIELMLNTYICG